MNKILRGKLMKLYEDDQDLLEDVLIELKQAEEFIPAFLPTWWMRAVRSSLTMSTS